MIPNSRKLILTLGTLLAVTAGTAFADSRPNIVVIYSDDHAYQAISAYGSRLADVAPTPNIDRIARQGIRFDRATVTNSICAPARAVMLTGKYSHVNGVINNRTGFDNSQATFPKLLQQAGYETAIIGKWHLRTDPTGFDHWEVLHRQGHYYNPDFKSPAGMVQVEGYVSELITEKTIDWLESRSDADKPFLLMMQHKAPHREWEPGPQQIHYFANQFIPEPENLFDDYANRASAARLQDMSIENTMRMREDLKVYDRDDMDGDSRWATVSWQRMTEGQQRIYDAAYGPRNRAFRDSNLKGDDLVRWKYQQYLKDYLRTIRSIDESVGELLNYLEANDLVKNTIVIYTSDQGFYLGEHGWFDKRFMYEESFRTPLLMQWPGRIAAGSATSKLVSNLDMAPTLLDLAGAEIDPSMQGLSLRPILDGEEDADWRDAVYYRYYEYPYAHQVEPHEGVATERYKLINFLLTDEWELFDRESDPHEMNSVYADPEYARVRSRLKRRLDELKVQYGVGPDEPTHILYD